MTVSKKVSLTERVKEICETNPQKNNKELKRLQAYYAEMEQAGVVKKKEFNIYPYATVYSKSN